MRACVQLAHLDLHACGIGDAGATSLADALALSTSLQVANARACAVMALGGMSVGPRSP